MNLKRIFKMKLMKTLFYSMLAAILLVSCGQESGKNNEAKEITYKKPNILLLVGDDIAFGDLEAFGSEIPTPNMNRLADAGVRFSNFHALRFAVLHDPC